MSRLLRRRTLVAVGALTIMGACANGGTPGVRVQALQADIVFGVEKPEDKPTSLTPTPTGDDTGGIEDIGSGSDVPFENDLPDRFKDLLRPPADSSGTDTCPAADAGAAPAVIAGRNTTEPPAAGVYRYRISGTRVTEIDGTKIKTTLVGFEPRIVGNVEKTSDTQWSFDVTKPWADGARTESWSVNTNPTEVRDATSGDRDGDGLPDGRGVNPPYVGENSIRVGEPGRGIALTGYKDTDEDGNGVGSFNPTPELLYLPLPVLPGEDFKAFGLDTRQGRSVQVDGSVQRTQTVDACGQLVDGWLVEYTFTDATSSGTTTSTEQWIFSTPMGGLPISQRYTIIETNGALTTTTDVTYSIGQQAPTALRSTGT